MVISRRRYPVGVNIVLLARLSDHSCYLKTPRCSDAKTTNRNMSVEIVIEPLTEDPLLSTGIVIAFYLGTCESPSAYQ